MAFSRRLSLVAVLVALAGAVGAPVAAVAQSAGDEQYLDPFEQDGSEESSSHKGSSGKEPQSSQGSTGTGTAAPSSAAPSYAAPSQAAPTQAPATALARTGSDLRIPLAAGLVLLLAGTLLFRWSRPVRN